MNPKQREFARLYALEPNAKKAALAAGYSASYANTNGVQRLLQNEEVVAEIQRLRQRMNERAEKSSTDVVNEYAKIAFTDRVDFLKEDPLRPGFFIYKSPDELNEEQRAVVERVSMTTEELKIDDVKHRRQRYTYTLADKANALQQMGRHFGIFDDKLKLVQSQQNPFASATPEQLAKLKQSFVGIMSGETVDGEYQEIKNVLPNGKGRTGTGG
jgi:phage terminase small subunit